MSVKSSDGLFSSEKSDITRRILWQWRRTKLRAQEITDECPRVRILSTSKCAVRSCGAAAQQPWLGVGPLGSREEDLGLGCQSRKLLPDLTVLFLGKILERWQSSKVLARAASQSSDIVWGNRSRWGGFSCGWGQSGKRYPASPSGFPLLHVQTHSHNDPHRHTLHPASWNDESFSLSRVQWDLENHVNLSSKSFVCVKVQWTMGYC